MAVKHTYEVYMQQLSTWIDVIIKDNTYTCTVFNCYMQCKGHAMFQFNLLLEKSCHVYCYSEKTELGGSIWV